LNDQLGLEVLIIY